MTATQPPPLVAALRRAVEELCASRDDVVVVDGDVTGPGSSGWNTTVSPVGRGWTEISRCDRSRTG